MVKRIFKLSIMIMTIAIILVGCNGKKINVGYSVYPIEYLVKEIAQDKANLIPLSEDKVIMRAKLKDDYTTTFKEANVIFTIGELEPYMEVITQDIIDLNPNIIELATKSAAFEFSRVTKVNIDNHIVDLSSKYYENPAFDNVDTYNIDPYLWLDPIIMTSMANQIKDYFISVDPDNTQFYTNNFEEIKIKLAYLDANYLSLRKKINYNFATMVPAFGIWQNNYDFAINPIIVSKFGVLPTKQQLDLIKVRLENDGVQYLIVEEQLDEDIMELANTLAKDLDLEIVNISSLSFRSKKQIEDGFNYLDIMNENLRILENLDKEIDLEE